MHIRKRRRIDERKEGSDGGGKRIRKEGGERGRGGHTYLV